MIGRRSERGIEASRAWSRRDFRTVLPFALCLAACGGGPADRSPPPLQVEYTGCREIYKGRVCIRSDGQPLTLWIKTSPEARWIIEAADSQQLSSVEIQGGHRVELELAPGLGHIEVRSENESGQSRWRLELGEPVRPPWYDRAAQLSQSDPAAAKNLLLERLSELSLEHQGLAYSQLGSLEQAAGHTEQAEIYLRRAIEALHRSGRVLDEMIAATSLIYFMLGTNRFAEARAELDELRPPVGAPGEVAIWISYYWVLLATNTSHLRAALAGLEDILRRAERLGLRALAYDAEQIQARLFRRLGRGADEAALSTRLRREMSTDLDPCRRGLVLTNVGWILLLAREAGETAEDPIPLLREALDLFERESCPAVDQRANLHTNLALGELQAGKLDRAEHHLEEARRLRPEPEAEQQLWWWDIAARVALGGGGLERALSLYERMAATSELLLWPDAQWRAAFGKARTLVALGREPEALAAFALAEELVSRESLLVPIDAGRDTLVAQRERGTRQHLALLLELGLVEQALELARRSRSRVLLNFYRQERLASLTALQQASWDQALAAYRARRQALDASAGDDWRRPADELRRVQVERQAQREDLQRALDAAFEVLDQEAPAREAVLTVPGTGELRLYYHRIPEGWVGFAQSAAGVAHRPIGELRPEMSPSELAAHLLLPFEKELREARRARVMPYGFLREVDFHALPFEDAVLLDFLPVTYGLDLPPAPRTGMPLRKALVVANPNGDLPSASAEAKVVHELLERQGWTIRLLLGKSADGESVREALSGQGLFHYAGHGVFAGRGGWESALPLANGSRLTVSDVLALPEAPEWIVLSGCETGRTSVEAPLETVAGLAQAFLSVGSRGVIAAIRPVEDRTASRLLTSFYGKWLSALPADEALRRAQLALRNTHPESDWASFRIIEP